MKKILLVHSSFPHQGKNYGGAKKMITWLGNTLSNEGFEVTFCSCYDVERPDSFLPSTKTLLLKIPYHSNYIFRNFYLFWYSYRSLKDFFQTEKVDCVISFGDLSFFVLLVLRKRFGYKVVVSERLDPKFSSGFMDIFRRWCFRYSDVLVCQSEGAKECFNSILQEKIVVIPNPITLPDYHWCQEKTEKTIATAGRLTIIQKRQDVLIKAFSIFHSNHSDYLLKIYGDGPDMQKLKKLTEDLCIDDYVRFIGRVKDVQQYLLNDGVFVLTSDFEGVPNALLEAMALGMPVISTKCSPGGAEMLIKNKENGLLVECGDAEDVANAMSFMVENKDLCVEFAKNARSSVKRYNPHKIIMEWEQLLN